MQKILQTICLLTMIERVYSTENLEKAWLWIKSNPDQMYKRYFRSSYKNFETIRDQFIEETRRELEQNTYYPNPANKIFFPKPSGILRPYSLLTVKDQLVYQAFANIVAEQIYPHVRARYNKKTFGHQYAGPDSTWFYKKWSTGYGKFNKATKKSYEKGKVYSASFDLTACYDSIDHGVLSHYLSSIACSDEFSERLCSYLSVWTATDHREPIYQHHGIPQGPLSSGILSESVLKAFDDERLINGVSYFRYVDDIKLFSDSETQLRAELVRLDTISKKIGLFPQSSKIGIHKIKNIEDELQSLSHPGRFKVEFNQTPQSEITKKIVSATAKYELRNVSALKYYTALTSPNKQIVERLWRLYGAYPHVYEILCKVLIKCNVLPNDSYRKILKELNKKNPYDAVYAEFINVLYLSSLTETQQREVSKTVKERFYGNGSNLLRGETVLSCNVCKLLIKLNSFTDRQIIFISNAPKWQTRAVVAEELSKNANIPADLIASLTNDQIADVSLHASSAIILKRIGTPERTNVLASNYLHMFGRNIDINETCHISLRLNRMLDLDHNQNIIDWRVLLQNEYQDALEEIVRCSTSITTNVRLWIIELDSFNEIILRKFVDLDGAIGAIGTNYGRIFGQGSAFQTKYQQLHDTAERIHSRRHTSAHPYNTNRQRNIPFRYDELAEYVELQRTILIELHNAINNLN